MAEGSGNFDFTVSIPIDADFSRFRATAQKEIEQFQKTPVSLPLGGAGAGGVGGFATPSGAQSSTAIATAAQNAVQMALSPVYGIPGVSAGMVGGNMGGGGLPPGFINIPNAGGGGWGGGPGGNVVNNYLQQAAMMHGFGGTAAGGFMGPDGQINSERTYWSDEMWQDQIAQLGAGSPAAAQAASAARGQGNRWGARFIALGAVHTASRMAMATLEHGRAQRAADGDPESLARADMTYQKSMAESAPLVGGLIYAAHEGITGENEAIETTLRQSKQQDERIDQMRRAESLHTQFRTAGALARTYGGVERARVEAGAEYNQALRTIQSEQAKSEATARLPFTAQRAELDRELKSRLGPINYLEERTGQGGFARAQVEEWAAGERRKIDQAESGVMANIRRPFEGDRDAAQDVRDRAIRDAERGIRDIPRFELEGQRQASFYRTQNRPFEASMSERMTQMGLDLVAADPANRPAVARAGLQGMAEETAEFARGFGATQQVMATQRAVAERVLARDPLGAELAGIRGARDQALTDAQSLPWGFRQIRQATIRAGAGVEELVARQRIADQQSLRTGALQADVDVSELEATGQEKSAHAEAIRRRAELSAEASRDRGDPKENQRLILQAAINEERLYERELRRRGEAGSAMDAYPGAIGAGASSGGLQMEPLTRGLDSVREAVKDLQAALTGAE